MPSRITRTNRALRCNILSTQMFHTWVDALAKRCTCITVSGTSSRCQLVQYGKQAQRPTPQIEDLACFQARTQRKTTNCHRSTESFSGQELPHHTTILRRWYGRGQHAGNKRRRWMFAAAETISLLQKWRRTLLGGQKWQPASGCAVLCNTQRAMRTNNNG